MVFKEVKRARPSGGPPLGIAKAVSVAATPHETWSTLVRFERYPDWTTAVAISGEAQMGNSVVYSVPLRSRWGQLQSLKFEGDVVEVSPERRLAWDGGVRGLMLLQWAFEVAPEGRGARVTHTLKMSGILALLFGWRLRQLLPPRMEVFLTHLRTRLQRSPLKATAKHPPAWPQRSGRHRRGRSR